MVIRRTREATVRRTEISLLFTYCHIITAFNIIMKRFFIDNDRFYVMPGPNKSSGRLIIRRKLSIFCTHFDSVFCSLVSASSVFVRSVEAR